MMDRLDNELSFSRNALNLRSVRQEMLASNIANADTPHYKARDLDFKSALAGAMSGKQVGPVLMAKSNAAHLGGIAADTYGAAMKYRTEYQASVDGNTVNMDVERSAFAENGVQIEALLTFVRTKLSDLRTAVQGN